MTGSSDEDTLVTILFINLKSKFENRKSVAAVVFVVLFSFMRSELLTGIALGAEANPSWQRFLFNFSEVYLHIILNFDHFTINGRYIIMLVDLLSLLILSF